MIEKNETGKTQSAEWLRQACSSDSIFGDIPTLLSFTDASTPRHHHSGDPFPALKQDIARFMLVRGKYSWLGYGWEGCITTEPPVVAHDHDYGRPAGRCKETSRGVFERAWTKAHVTMDCNRFEANITNAAGRRVL